MLRCLDVAHNALTSLAAVGHLPFLEELHAAHNKLTQVKELDNPALRVLDISHNAVTGLDGVNRLPALVTLLAAKNRVTDLHPLEVRLASATRHGRHSEPLTLPRRVALRSIARTCAASTSTATCSLPSRT